MITQSGRVLVVHWVRRYWVFLPVLVTALALMASISARAPAAQAPAPHLLPTRALTLEPLPGYQLTRRFAGQVLARQDADVGFELAGQLADVRVNDGDRVVAGQVLARLDTALLATERTQLQAQLADNRARQTLNQANIERHGRLQAGGFASQQRLDELETERDTLRAAADALGAQLSNVDTRLHKAQLRAPFSGVVARRYADQGMVVNAGSPVLKLQQQGEMEVAVGVPVPFALQLVVSQQVAVELRDEILNASVLSIGADVHPITNTVNVRLLMPDSARGFNGDIVHLHMSEVIAQPGFWVPADAVASGMRGRWVVYSLVQLDGLYRVQARDVQIHHTEGDRVFISGALTAGEKLVAAGIHRLVPGQAVSLLPDVDSDGEQLGERGR
ncbi:efflux RND transporter periplasmic adaptor subunit [Simiduia agarivorans]|uniref:RND family efflux transporter MFP subunit n=1 Tax=Simiduia agarivorans (strain DSM 21679 / JCM 13881 / BCRC 17597 / SA1) TaxID=1117647 RepID=K4KQQ9_SIMAS|nr:efflux RND transporter periplasmic adaptor subunit [Simiduia agarivorans]AFV00601.1 RND family efflux transporter MFP subunit [Simiduia agarivorans SA1 = DSM 21679]